MFLKINTAGTGAQLSPSAHILSGAVWVLGGVVKATVRASSQTERQQFRRLEAKLRHLTSASSDQLRTDMFKYAEARFRGYAPHVDLPFGFDRIVDTIVADVKKSKAA